MNKVKRPKSTIFTFISIIAVIIVLFYINRSQQSSKMEESSKEKLSEIQRMLKMDLDSEYPETPREVAKLHGDMTRLLYSGIKDDEVDELAMKIRELYDEEFLENNPVDQYLTNLYSDISYWQEVDRKIENDFVVNENLEENYKKDGKEYATAYISFTITEKGKVPEIRRYLMRKDENKKWKILGWEYINERNINNTDNK